MSASDGFEGVGSWGDWSAGFEFFEEGIEDQEEGWRVGVVWVLDLEFLGDFAAGFLAEYLLTADPAIFIHEIEPASYNVEALDIQYGI